MFSFAEREKKYFDVELTDGTTLLLKMPKKSLFEKISDFQKTSKNNDKDYAATYNEVFEIAAEILSNNTSNKTFTANDVEETVNVLNVFAFVKEYFAAVNAIANSPN